MKIRKYVLLPAAALLAACGAQNQDAEGYAPAAVYEQNAAADAVGGNAVRADDVMLSQRPQGRQMVVEAEVSFKTKDSRQTLSELEKLTLKHGGFVEKKQHRSGKRRRARLPAARRHGAGHPPLRATRQHDRAPAQGKHGGFPARHAAAGRVP